ncbi:MAG TPA: amidohydrolase [Armatimonadota bacterium]|nr:amidohydrolase [Armatimonadota bacterium]
MSHHWQQQLDQLIDARSAELIAVRRRLHAYPEPSGEEHETSLFLHQLLADSGFEVQLGVEGRGVVADLPGCSGVPQIALRADIDALRIHDVKQVEYRSQRDGLMHACGHDGHTAAVLGAILGLRAAVDSGILPWPVCWRGIFQPAEETGQGALEMVASGALDGVSGILALHMDPSRPVGRVGLRYGALTAACDALSIDIAGRGGHAARPHESLDPIAAAAQLISSIYLFIPRATDSHDPVVITIGQITAGDNPNVIPESAQLRGTVRTLGGEARERTKNHIRQLARGLAEASSTGIQVRFEPGPQSVNNDSTMTDLIREAARDLLGEERLDVISRPSMGGEDFAFYLDHVPGAMFRLGCASPSAGNAPLHSPAFDLDERALAIGAKVLARAAVLWSDPARREQV